MFGAFDNVILVSVVVSGVKAEAVVLMKHGMRSQRKVFRPQRAQTLYRATYHIDNVVMKT